MLKLGLCIKKFVSNVRPVSKFDSDMALKELESQINRVIEVSRIVSVNITTQYDSHNKMFMQAVVSHRTLVEIK